MTAGDQVIYIAGYSRCGSTVLSMLLGSHPSICSVGEVCFLPDDWLLRSRVCSCGAIYPDCAFWGGASRSVVFDEEKVRLVRRFESRKAFAAMAAAAGPFDADSRHYAAFTRGVLDHARAASGAPIILDSSKSARAAAARPLALSRLAGQDVKVIHLVRDGYAMADSYRKHGSNWVREGHRKRQPFTVYRSMLGWRLANDHAAKLQSRLGAERYLRLAYSDLIAAPAAALKRIGVFCDLDFSAVIARIEADDTLDSAHQVGGNRVRFEAPRFRRDASELPPVDLPAHQKLAFRFLAGER